MIDPTRRMVLAGLGTAGLAGRAMGAPARPAFRNTLSLGLNAERALENGIRFTDGKRTATDVEGLQRLFVAHGATEIYARIGTSRTAKLGALANSLERGLERARLARKLGLALNPELGLWIAYGGVADFSEWPDLGVAKPWTAMTLKERVPVARGFAAGVARALLATGVGIDSWHLSGDERGIGGLTLPPWGPFGGRNYVAPDVIDPAIGRIDAARFEVSLVAERIAFCRAHLWPAMGRLLAAMAEGVRSVDRAARFSLHVGSGSTVSYQPELVIAFFRAMAEAGFAVDQPAICFFPANAGTPADRVAGFKDTVVAVRKALGKPLYIAEAGYPVGPVIMGGAANPFDWGQATPGYPLGADGQARIIRDIVRWGMRSGSLSGIRQWGPDDVTGGWAPLSLFDLDGTLARARPALGAVAAGLRAAA